MGGGKGLNLAGPNVHKQAASEAGQSEQRPSIFTRLGTDILLRERELGTFKIRHFHMGRRACNPSVVEISETEIHG